MGGRVQSLLLFPVFPFAATVFGILLASASSADPILTVLPDEIELSPTTTVVTVVVDPNDTPLSAVVLNFSSLASGLEMLAVTPTDAEITSSGPALNGDDWEGGFVGGFEQDRTQQFEVGTLTLEGFESETPLVLTGNYTDRDFNDILIDPTDVAFVVPEPATSALQLAALGAVLGLRRSRVRHRLSRARSAS